jgi:dimeric dUTPase (all-alpha-NTP-PPase superfamily)
MEDTEDTSSVRISSFQPQATQNYIDILSLSPPLSLSLYQDATKLTLPFNNASDLTKECFLPILLEVAQFCHISCT